MDKNNILNDAKKQMSNIIKDITFDNMETSQKNLEQYLSFLNSLGDLEVRKIRETKRFVLSKDKTLHGRFNLEENMTTLLEESSISSIEESKEKEVLQDDKTYTFERKIRGGLIAELEEGYVIPERMVRDMGIGHLDKVKITSMKKAESPYEKNQYWFDIVERVNAIVPNRCEYKFCKVEKDFGEYLVKESFEGDIRIDGVPFPIILRNEDILTFSIQDGDIVDIAFYENNPSNTIKILYKYNTESMSEDSSMESNSSNSNQSKNKKKKGKDNKQLVEREGVINKGLLKNRKVLIVGGMHRKSDYKSTFEGVGSIFDLATGDETKDSLAASISKADIVVIAVGQCSHDASIFTVTQCKRFGIPFASTHQQGLQSMLLCAEEAVRKGIKDNLIEEDTEEAI